MISHEQLTYIHWKKFLEMVEMVWQWRSQVREISHSKMWIQPSLACGNEKVCACETLIKSPPATSDYTAFFAINPKTFHNERFFFFSVILFDLWLSKFIGNLNIFLKIKHSIFEVRGKRQKLCAMCVCEWALSWVRSLGF